MTGEMPDFDELMRDAHLSMLSLDGVTGRDSAKITSVSVSHGKRLYLRLLEYQRSAWMTAAEAHALDSAMEQLRARLKFFGEAV